jgi:3-dehydroquinate dehydratase-2
VARARAAAGERGFTVDHVQSNHEGVLVDAVHAARATTAGLVVNAGAFTHYAWALHDALAAYDPPVIELHLSNPTAREPWRHTSVIAPVATAVIAGLGGRGYPLAVTALIDLVEDDP